MRIRGKLRVRLRKIRRIIAVLLAAIAFLRCKGEVQYASEISRLEAELDNCERIEERIECEVTATSDNELYVVTDDELAVLSPIWHNIVSLLRALELSRGGIYTSISRNGGAFCKKLLDIDTTQISLYDIRLAVRQEISGIEKKIIGMGKKIDSGFARNDYYARAQGIAVPAQIIDSGRKGKWNKGFRKKLLDAAFDYKKKHEIAGYSGICERIYKLNEQRCRASGITLKSFQRACENHRA